MGCSCSNKIENNPEYLTIEFFSLEKYNINGEYILKKNHSEFLEIKPNLSIFDYLNTPTNDLSKKFVDVNHLEIKNNNFSTKNSLYIFYYSQLKFPKIKDLNYTKNFKPFDENILNEDNKIKKLIILSMENFQILGIDKKEFYNKLDHLLKANPKNSELENKILRIISEEVSLINESEPNDNKIESEINQGKFIYF